MEKRKLSSLCLLEKGKQIDTETLDDKNIFPYVNGGIKESGFYESYNTSGDTITISEGGASCGFVNYRNDKFWCGCHCYRLTNFNVNFKYLYFALKANQKNIMDLRSGVAMPNIKKSRLEDLMINIDEDAKKQDKIVKELSELTESIGKEQTAILEFNELIKSRFIEMFENSQCEEINLGAISEKITKGSTPTTYGFSFLESGINFIKIESIDDNNRFLMGKLAHVSNECHQSFKRSQLAKGDILFSIAGALGRTAIVDESILPANTNQALAIIKIKASIPISKAFLLREFETEFVKDQLEKDVVGIAQKNLSLQNLNELMIKLPPISEQRNFEIFVNQVDKLKFNAQKRIDLFQELLNKKMDEYFN